MSKLKRVMEKQDLGKYPVFVEDIDANSKYFSITEFPQVLSGGKNGFLITGTDHLELGTTVKIEILDVDGNPIYYEIAKGRPSYYEGKSKVISVWVYADTPVGVGKITVLGELRTFVDGQGERRDIPEEWSGVYNVRWERDVLINNRLANETKVRFKSRPIISVTENIGNIQRRTATVKVISGSISGSAVSPPNGKDWFRYRGNTEYRLKISGSTWDSLIVSSEGEVDVPVLSQGYVTTIKKILNETTALASTPYFTTSSNNVDSVNYKQVVSDFSADSFTATYTSESFVFDDNNEGTSSFARITVSDLETFSGDVHRIRLYRRPIGSTVESDYELVQDQVIESKEELVDSSKSGVEFRTGVFRNQSTVNDYWQTSSFFLTASVNSDVLFQSVNLTSSANITQIVSGSSKIPAYYFTTASNDVFVTQLLTYESRSLSGTGTFTGSVYYASESVSGGGPTQHYYISESVTLPVISLIPTGSNDNTIFVLYEASSSLADTPPYTGNVYAYSSSVESVYTFNSTQLTTFTTGSEYSVDFTALGLNNGILDVYLSGSGFNNVSGSELFTANTYGKYVGSVRCGPRTLVDFSENFESDTNGTGVLNFVIRGGNWYLSGISLKEYFETNFSPNKFETILQTPTTITNQTYEFKAEFFDVNSNKIDVVALSNKKDFYGGNLLGKGVTFNANRGGFTFSQTDVSGSITRQASPPNQTVVFTTTTRGLITGSVLYTSQAFDTNGVQIPSSSYVTASIVSFLTNTSHSVSTAVDGTGGDYSDSSGSFKVYSGIDDRTSQSVFTLLSTSTGVTASIDETGSYSASLGDVTDSGTATFNAVSGDTTLEHIFTVSKEKTGLTRSLYIYSDPEVGLYQESSSLLPQTDDVTFYVQQKGLSGTIVSGDFTVTKNDGTNIITSSLSGTVAGGTGVQAFTASFSGNNSSSFTLTRSDFPLTASVSKDSIDDVYYMFSAYGGDTYPGTLVSASNSGALLPVANYTGSSRGYTVDSIILTASSEGKADSVTVLSLLDGFSGRQYFIRPVFGSVLKNKDGGDPDNLGNLEVEIVKFANDGLVSSSADLGNIKLYSASVELTDTMNGIIGGSRVGDTRYNARISGSAITGSLVLTAEDTGSGILWDSITLSDLQDGLPAGYVTATRRVIKRNPNNNTYNVSFIGVTGSFYIPNNADGTGTTHHRYISIDPNWNGSLDQMSWSYDAGGNSDIILAVDDLDGNDVPEDTYSNTQDLSLTFTYTDPTYGISLVAEETFYIAVDGVDGSGSINTIANTILPLSGTFFSTNPNSGLHQPAWLEFRTQTNTSGSVYNIASGSESYLRRQRDNFNITASGDNITYRVSKDEINSLEVFEWYSGSTPTIVDTISISDITDGTNSVSYLIRPFFGTVLKNKDGGNSNNPGNLEIQLVKISGSQEYILDSGDVKLYSASVELSAALNGISAGTATGSPYNGSGILPYHAQISGSAITGSLTIIAKSGSVVADTIALADLQDGVSAGWITANPARLMTRNPQDNNSYTPSSLGVTGSFYIPDSSDGAGTTFSRYVGIDSNWTGTLDQMSWSYEPGGNSGITVVASDNDGNTVSEDVYSETKDLSLTFTFVDPVYGNTHFIEETFYIVSDGTDGESAPSGILQLDDNNRVWFYNPNDGTYTPADTTNGITASFYIGDTLTARRGWPISISGKSLLTGSENTTLRSGDWTNTSIDVNGGNTSNMVIAFTSASITVREQFSVLSEPRNNFGLSFSPENKVVNAGPSGDVISGLPDTINVYLYVDGELETDYTSWTWESSSANLTVAHSADDKSFLVSNFTPNSLEQAITSVTASKAYDDFTTTLQGSFTVTKAFQGRQGPGVVYIGAYDDLSPSWPMQNDDVRRDIVSHNSTYYYYTGSDGALKSAIDADLGHPTGSNTAEYWGTFTNFSAVATDILLAQDAYIGRVLNIGTDKTTGEANITLNGTGSVPYLSLGQSIQNYGEPGVFLGSGSVSGETAKFSILGSTGAFLFDGSTFTIQGAVRQTSAGTAIGDSRGDWSDGIIYYVNDLVGHVGSDSKNRVFRVKVNHTSTAGSTPSEIAAVDNTGDATSDARYELYIDTGAAGVSGSAAKSLSITGDSYIISFDDAADTTATPDIITFSIAQQNLTGAVLDVDFTVKKNNGTNLTKSPLTGTITSGSGTQTSTLSYSGNSLSKSDLPLTASVSKDSITDAMNVFKIEGGGAGSSAKSLILTSNSYIISFDNAADTTATPDTITFSIAQQNLDAPVVESEFTVKKNDGNNLVTSSFAGAITAGSGIQTSTISYSGNSLSKTDLPLTASVTSDSITDTVHIFKVEGGSDGTNGVSGSDGSDGSDGYTVFLTNGTHTFPADASGSVADSNEGAGTFEVRLYSGSTQLIYSAGGGVGTYTVNALTYDPASNITLNQTTNSNQRRFTPTAVSNTYNSGSVTVPIVDNNNSQSFDLVYTWAKAKSGERAYTVFATNPSHTFPANSSGTVSDYSGGGTRIVVYEGTDKLIHTTGTTGDGQYKVTVVTDTNITAGSISTNNNEALVAAPSSMTDDGASIYFNVEINPSIGTATFNSSVTQSFSKSKQGVTGASGSAAKGLSIKSDSYIISFDDEADTTATPDTVTFTISQQNLSATVLDADFTVKKNNGTNLTKSSLSGTVTDGTGTRTSTLSYSGNSLSKTDLPLTASVTKDSITDTLNVFKIEGGGAGSTAKSLILNSDSYIFAFDNAADTTATPDTVTFSIAQQNLASTVIDGEFTVRKNNGTALTKSSLTGTVTSGSGIQTSTLSYSGNSLSKTDLPLTASVNSDSITDTIHIFKVEGGSDGTNGTNGSNGADGSDGYTVFLTNGAHTFPADASGSVADSNEGAGAFEVRLYSGSTQLIYTAGGGTGTYNVGTLVYDPASNITLNQTTNSNQRRFTPTAVSNTYNSGSVTVPITDNNNSQTFEVVYTWAKAKSGERAYTVFATNPSHTFSANNAGTVSDYSGGGTRIVVYEGTDKLIHTTGTTGDGQYKVTVVTDTNITAGSISTNNNEALVAAPSSMTADNASIYFNVEINPSIGTATFNSSVTQSFSKSKQGDIGTPGTSGTDGPGIVYRGDYSSGVLYYSSSIRRDVVSHGGSYYLSNVNASSATTPPSANWSSFGAQFDSVATNILLSEYANVTKGLVIGHAATELGGSSNPSSSFIRTSNALSLTSGQGFFLSSSGEFTMGDFDGARISISGSTFVISGSNGSWESSGALYATDATLLGFISSSAGRIGGFDIGGTSLTSIGGSITLDGDTESITVRDSGGTVRFLANTETSLPDPSLTDTITANVANQTNITDSWTTNGLQTNIRTYDTTFGSTPSYTGTYDFSATVTANASTKKVYSGTYSLADSLEARASVRLQIIDVSNNIVAESATHTISVNSSFVGKNVTVTFPTTIFKVSANVTSGATYKARWRVETRGGWYGSKVGSGVPAHSYFDIDGTEDVTGTYDLSKTIVNGGGFQAAASSTKYLRVQDSTPAVLVSGQLSVSGSVQVSGDIDGVGASSQIASDRIKAGSPLGTILTNQILSEGSIISENYIQARIYDSTNASLAAFTTENSEQANSQVGFFIGAVSGSLATSKKPYIAPIIGSTQFGKELYYDVANGIWVIEGGLDVVGALTKSSGTFKIPHPDPTKKDTHDLYHSFVESPTAGDNIYRFTINIYDGYGRIELPDYYVHLNENSQVWVSPIRHFGRAWGEVIYSFDSFVEIHADTDGVYNVLVIGTRKDTDSSVWNGAERVKR